MKVLLDTCVIYPTVMREMILGVAGAGAFTPLWSERIIGEWLHAAAKLGLDAQAQAAGEAALMAARWPGASVAYAPSLEARLWLPDPADTHVLAAAIAGSADGILTLNARDFPRNILAEEGPVSYT
ncbi:RSP_2648 family PIN domain-containing protein, partial [Roseovarius tolerans]|uniref:RSP_2648 family PIN domain-containing protein n=1 Tax=Roseovarius tolerans TaxID=74031 RepID=UPI00067F3D03